MITPYALRSVASNSSTASTEPRERLALDLCCAIDDGKRHIVHSDELIAAFLELKGVTRTVEVQSLMSRRAQLIASKPGAGSEN